MWTDDYIDIPFRFNGRTREGCDCWGLVKLIYKEKLGVDLPDYTGTYWNGLVSSLKEVARLMKKEKDKWQEISEPELYDVVLLRVGGIVGHIGIILDKSRMIHITEGINSCVENYKSKLWKTRIAGFYRRK
jgi:cell wall-associated NlpC family hydrolase